MTADQFEALRKLIQEEILAAHYRITPYLSYARDYAESRLKDAVERAFEALVDK